MSAVLASPADRERSSLDFGQGALQHTLYRAAKADPGRRFHTLMDKIWRRDVLWRGWVSVRRNNGAPGIDATTLDQVEQYGVARLLDELATELKEGRYRPLPARRVFIVRRAALGLYPLFSREELGGMFLGLMAYLKPKGGWDKSMLRHEAPCHIPYSVGRNSEGCFWV